jgi:hypothetical protein
LKRLEGRIRTLFGVLHIPRLAKSLIFVRKMDDAAVKTMFEKETCRMVQGAILLLKFGLKLYIRCRETLLMMGVTVPLFLILEPKMKRNPTVSGEKAMLWHQILGHIREKGFRLLYGKGMVEGIHNFSLDVDLCKH